MPIGKTMHRTQEYKLTPEFFFDDWTMTHRRWSCYRHYGVRCCVPGCHRVGTHVVHWYSRQDFVRYGDTGKGEHIDLVGFEPDGTTEYLMTVDHIVPDSKGGPKVWWNLQPMCEFHNGDQGNKMLYVPSGARLSMIQKMAGIVLPENAWLDTETEYKLLVAEFEKRMQNSSPRLRKIKDKY